MKVYSNPEFAGARPCQSENLCDEKGSVDSSSRGRYIRCDVEKTSDTRTDKEYSYNNAWNVNNNGNVNNNNKNNNNNYARPVRALASANPTPSCYSLFNQPQENKVLLTDLFEAYFQCRKNKRKTCNALAFEMDYENNLVQLRDEIENNSYQIGRSIAFIVDKPVKREVFAADFRDRVVHHYVVGKLTPLFEEQFIQDSYSCREGKGTLYGVKRIAQFVKECKAKHGDAYILKMDIEGFFMNIDKKILFCKLKNLIEEQYFGADKGIILWLCSLIVFNDPTKDCIIKGTKRDWEGLPNSKSLFHVGKNKGLPIGNLTSQTFANLYLDALDKFIIRTLGFKYYGRYVDDFIIVSEDKEKLKRARILIAQFLQTKLKLKLHPKKVYLQHCSKGVKFIGSVIKEDRLYIANRTKGNMWNSIQKHNAVVRDHFPSMDEIQSFQSSMNSYIGFMVHYRTYNIVRKMKRKELSAYWWNHIYFKKGYVSLKRKKLKSTCVNDRQMTFYITRHFSKRENNNSVLGINTTTINEQ